jgi:hypothetical protein
MTLADRLTIRADSLEKSADKAQSYVERHAGADPRYDEATWAAIRSDRREIEALREAARMASRLPADGSSKEAVLAADLHGGVDGLPADQTRALAILSAEGVERDDARCSGTGCVSVRLREVRRSD